MLPSSTTHDARPSSSTGGKANGLDNMLFFRRTKLHGLSPLCSTRKGFGGLISRGFIASLQGQHRRTVGEGSTESLKILKVVIAVLGCGRHRAVLGTSTRLQLSWNCRSFTSFLQDELYCNGVGNGRPEMNLVWLTLEPSPLGKFVV